MTTIAKLPVRPAATLIVAAPIPTNAQRQGQSNYRLLMMKRNGKSSFVHAHVFPGGVVDEQDNESLWKTHLPMSNSHMLTYKICAIRETFEESGLLLTTPPAHTVPELDTELWRHRVHEDASQFKRMCNLYQLQPAVDRLIPFANWITPSFEKKRFDTVFFLTILGQTVDEEHRETVKVSADGKETVQLDWLQPEEGLNLYNQNKIVFFPPQWYAFHCFKEIPRHEDLQDNVGIGALRTKSGYPVTVRPQMNRIDDDQQKDYHGFLAYPGDECYSTANEDTSNDFVQLQPGKKGDRHRLYFRGKIQDVALERNVDVTQFVRSQL